MNSLPGSTATFLQNPWLTALVWLAGVGVHHLTTLIEVRHISRECEEHPVAALMLGGKKITGGFSGRGVGARA